VTRIIAGTAGGQRLASPPGTATRPTSDRVREALFSRLGHQGWLDGTRVLDLYAGSGALGLEAASRGAAHVLAVEQAAAVALVVRRNADSTGLPVHVRADRAERVLAQPPEQTYDLVLADPPYPLGEAELAQVLRQLVDGRWLADPACVVVERSSRSPEPTWPRGLSRTDERSYGETRLWFAQSTDHGTE
jgi:16S rRNA (guanine966-N2)-methyltransferase